MSEHCICCGSEIPEGRQLCLICEEQVKKWHIPLDMFEERDDDDKQDE